MRDGMITAEQLQVLLEDNMPEEFRYDCVDVQSNDDEGYFVVTTEADMARVRMCVTYQMLKASKNPPYDSICNRIAHAFKYYEPQPMEIYYE